MQARLKVLHDKANVKQVKLLPVTLIGRSTECNLKIASSQVSRAHCRITLGEDTVYVEDLGSANGTIVDGKRLIAHRPTSVLPGATLMVGPAEFLIDYVASTSATMVLSRFDVPVSPSLSSTELLLPAKKEVLAPAMAPTTSPPVSPVARAVLTVAKPVVAAPVGAVPLAAPVVAQPVVAAVPTAMPVAAQVAPVPNTSAPPTAAVPEETHVEMSFAGFAASVEEPVLDEAAQFMFGEPASFSDSPTAFAEPNTTPSKEKKGGVKSLFSMFGRKAKGTTPSTSPNEAPAPAINAPSVFLPTMDRGEADAEPIEFSFGEQAAVEPTTGTIVIEQPPVSAITTAGEAPAEDENGFQQFLKQL